MDVPYFSSFPAMRPGAAGTYSVPGVRPAVRVPSSPWYMTLLGLAMATGSAVMFEPAPVDILLVMLTVAGLLLGKLAFTRAHEAPFVLLALFLAANVISMSGATDMQVAVRYLAITAYLVATWVFFAGVTTRHGFRAVRVIMNGYTVGGLLSALAGTLSYLRIIGHQDWLLLFGRPRGFFKDPNVFGPYMVPVLVWSVVRLREGRRPLVKIWWSGAALLSTVAVFLSFSRGCWINAVVALGAYFALELLSGGWNPRRFFALAGAAAVLLVILSAAGLLIVNADPHLGFMLRQRLGVSGIQAYDVNHRLYAQELALHAVRQRPLGLGPGQMEVTFTIATHNSALRALVENGILGFLALCAMLALSVVRILKLALTAPDPRWRGLFVMLAACTIGLLANAQVIDTVHWRHMWLLLGLAWVSPPDRRAIASAPPVLLRARALEGGRLI